MAAERSKTISNNENYCCEIVLEVSSQRCCARGRKYGAAEKVLFWDPGLICIKHLFSLIRALAADKKGWSNKHLFWTHFHNTNRKAENAKNFNIILDMHYGNGASLSLSAQYTIIHAPFCHLSWLGAAPSLHKNCSFYIITAERIFAAPADGQFVCRCRNLFITARRDGEKERTRLPSNLDARTKSLNWTDGQFDCDCSRHGLWGWHISASIDALQSDRTPFNWFGHRSLICWCSVNNENCIDNN